MNGWRPVWPLAILMVVLVSWLFYRYAAPRRFRDWKSAGLVQAFIIALYAEMYGFPLTLYVLTGVLGLDIPLVNVSGHLWATLLGYGFVGQMIEMIVGYTFVIVGATLLLEGWREVYRGHRRGELVTDGLYRLVRHPQYTGIFIALLGQLIHWPTLPTLVLFPLIVWAYARLARREEREMVARFGAAYVRYQREVPRFLPRWGNWRALVSRKGRAMPALATRDTGSASNEELKPEARAGASHGGADMTEMKVKHIMTEDPACCSPDTPLRDVAQLMVENDCGCIPVTDSDGKPVGVVTDRDICCRVIALGDNPQELSAASCMTDTCVTVTTESSVDECCRTMEEKQIRRAVVVDEEGRCCGIVAQADIARHVSDTQAAEVVRYVSRDTGAPAQLQ